MVGPELLSLVGAGYAEQEIGAAGKRQAREPQASRFIIL